MTDLRRRDKAELLAQLAALEAAGVPTARALFLAAGRRRRRALSRRAREAAAALADGRDLARAGADTGLFDPLEAGFIESAAAGGNLTAALQRLAEFHRRRAARLRTLKVRLLPPVLIVLLAIFIRPLTDLGLGNIDGPEYLRRTLLVIFTPVLLIAGLLRVRAWLHGARARRTGFAQLADRALIRMPLFGKTHVRRCVNRGLEALVLLLESGMPISQALSLASGTIGNAVIAEEFRRAAADTQLGMTLSGSFQRGASVSPLALQFIATGEESGRLAEMIERYATRQRGKLESFDRELMAWSPRIAYFLILIWVAADIVLSAGGLPRYG